MKYDRYRFYATLDEKTCPVCGDLDMEVFAVNDALEGKNKPPMHPNCRCVIHSAPSDEEKEDIKRNIKVVDPETGKKMYKDLPPGMTFNQWKAEISGMPERVAVDPDLRWMANHGIERNQIDPTFRAMAMNVREDTTSEHFSARGIFNSANDERLGAMPAAYTSSTVIINDIFDEAKTLDDIERIAKEKYDIDMVNFDKLFEKDIDGKIDYENDKNKEVVKLIKGTMNNHSTCMQNDPKTASYQKVIRVTDELKEDEMIRTVPVKGEDGKFRTETLLSQPYFSDPKKLRDEVDKQVRLGWFCEGTTAENLINHDFIHSMHCTITYESGKLDDLMTTEEMEEVCKTDTRRMMKAYFNEKGIVSKGLWTDKLSKISGFAAHKDWEGFAEAGGNVINMGDNAKPLSKDIYKWLRSILYKQ